MLEELRWEFDVCVGEREHAAEVRAAQLARIDEGTQTSLDELQEELTQVRCLDLLHFAGSCCTVSRQHHSCCAQAARWLSLLCALFVSLQAAELSHQA